MNTETPQKNTVLRAPVVAIMGHVDHGKSTLLDYIRKTNVVEGEAGGITQHISAYEVGYEYEGKPRNITFLDTPGHAAFSHMRSRGAAAADIAILIISAEDSIKPQTREAIEVIKSHHVPYIVAINKIDKPNADPEQVKSDLLELGIYVEGYGGDIPFAKISAKSGEGVNELLDTICLLADLEEFTGDADAPASGFVIESHRSSKEGLSATLVIKNGIIKKGDYVVVGDTMAPTRIMRNFAGQNIDEAMQSSPIQIIGFDNMPYVGKTFQTYHSKKEAEEAVANCVEDTNCNTHAYIPSDGEEVNVVPVIIKSDVLGTGEAIKDEIEKLNGGGVYFKVLKQETGSINEGDLMLALSDKSSIILGFNVSVDSKTKKVNEFDEIEIATFNIIYKLTEWLAEQKEKLRFKKQVDIIQGEAKIIKLFSWHKGEGVVGCKVESGTLGKGEVFKLSRHGEVIGKGKITEIQQAKQSVRNVSGAKTEFGMMMNANIDPTLGDIVQTYIVEEK